jgi:hypothetical protein
MAFSLSNMNAELDSGLSWMISLKFLNSVITKLSLDVVAELAREISEEGAA